MRCIKKIMLILATIMLFASWGKSSAQDWNYSIIDTSLNYIGNSLLRIGPGGIPHVLYEDGTENVLKFATLDDDIWHIRTIDFTDNYDDYAIDRLGNLHIVSHQYNSYALRYILVTDSSMQIDTVMDDIVQYTGISICVDNNNKPHIAVNLFNRQGMWLTHFYEYSGYWIPQTMASVPDFGGHTDIINSPDDELFIATASSADTGRVTLWRNGGGNWNRESVYESTPILTEVSIALDEANPRIAFLQERDRGEGRANLL